MMRGTVFVGVAGICMVGCAFDPVRDRPARLQLGMNARSFAASSDSGGSIARQTPASEPAQPVYGQHEGVSAAAQFTMATSYRTYAGGEVEAGQLDASGSKLAGAYGVVGAETSLRVGSLAVELTGGWRSLRYGKGESEIDAFVLEPRVRGNVWLSQQVTLGAALGATLGEHDAWMAGVFVGVHSHAFDLR